MRLVQLSLRELELESSSAPACAPRRDRAQRIPPTLFLRHLADHQRTVLDLLADQLELLLALLVGSLAWTFHVIVNRSSVTSICRQFSSVAYRIQKATTRYCNAAAAITSAWNSSW